MVAPSDHFVFLSRIYDLFAKCVKYRQTLVIFRLKFIMTLGKFFGKRVKQPVNPSSPFSYPDKIWFIPKNSRLAEVLRSIQQFLFDDG
jgi:hypothetical protein